MRSLLTLMLAAAMLPSLSQAQTVNICDRTPAVRDEIMLELGASDCAAVDLASVSFMQLADQHLTTLQAGDFNGLTSLQILGLGSNQLTALPEGVFNGLTSLQYLELQENHLVGLTENDPLFARLPNGVDLYLRGQTAAPGQPTPPEEPETPEPETPGGELAAKVAALETRMAGLEASMRALSAAMALQRTTLDASMTALQETLEATNAMLQDNANRISALEQREPEVRTSTWFIPVPVE